MTKYRSFLWLSIVLTVVFSGCSQQAVQQPVVEQEWIRFIDPWSWYPIFKWDDTTVQDEGVHDDNPTVINTVELSDEWRNASVLKDGAEQIYRFAIKDKGTLEFSTIAVVKNLPSEPVELLMNVHLTNGVKSFEHSANISHTTSKSAVWDDIRIPVEGVTGDVTCKVSFTASAQTEIIDDFTLFLGTPFFVPETCVKKPTVVFWVFDSMRDVELGVYGSPVAASPTLDLLSKQGVTFTNALSTSCWTLPGVQNMITGQILHEIQSEATSLRSPRHAPLPIMHSEFAKAGYMTIGISSNHIVTAKQGINLGCDIYDISASTDWMKGSGLDLHRVIDKYLKRYSDRPLCFYIHAMDPHDPYLPIAPYDKIFDPPKEQSVRKRIRQNDAGYLNRESFRNSLLPLTDTEVNYLRSYYRGEIRQMDSLFLVFMEMLKNHNLLDDAILCVTADHGEEFGEQGFYQHGINLHEPSVGVPWILVDLNGKHQNLVAERVSTIDVPRTLLNFAGVNSTARFQGMNALTNIPVDRSIFTVVRTGDDLVNSRWRFRSIYKGPRKMIWHSNSTIQGYDLDQNPEETALWKVEGWDALTQSSLDASWKEMGKELKRFVTTTNTLSKAELDSSTQDKLRQLGYIE